MTQPVLFALVLAAGDVGGEALVRREVAPARAPSNVAIQAGPWPS